MARGTTIGACVALAVLVGGSLDGARGVPLGCCNFTCSGGTGAGCTETDTEASRSPCGVGERRQNGGTERHRRGVRLRAPETKAHLLVIRRNALATGRSFCRWQMAP